jgi:hypothetical protein
VRSEIVQSQVGELCSVRRAAHGDEASELSRGSCFAAGANRGANQVGKFSGSCDGLAASISVVGEIGAALAFGGRCSPASTASHSLGALEVKSNIGGLGASALLGNSVGNELAIFAILVVENRRAQVIKVDWATDTFLASGGAASLLRDFNVSQAC